MNKLIFLRRSAPYLLLRKFACGDASRSNLVCAEIELGYYVSWNIVFENFSVRKLRSRGWRRVLEVKSYSSRC